MSAARRSRRTRTRLPAVIEAGDPALGGELMPVIHVGRLKTSADWARELSRLYRQMRKGQIPLSAGSRLAFVGRIAATQTRLVEELQHYREALTEWRRVHSDGAPAPLPEICDPFEQSDSDDAALLPTNGGADALAMQE
jgi:hypothetical protein